MKKMIFLLVTAPLLVMSGCAATQQSVTTTVDGTEIELNVDSINCQNAIYALENYDFVLEANSLATKRGRTIFVNSSTNFISLSDGKAVVQIAAHPAAPGPNGIGGITVEGRVSNVELKTDKKGNRMLSMNVFGTGISATVFITLAADSHTATATVTANTNPAKVILNGYLYPSVISEVYKGRSL